MNEEKQEMAGRPPASFLFKKEDFNPEIGEAQIERLKELDLLPFSRDDLGLRFTLYFPSGKLVDTKSQIAREIVRKQPNVRLEDLLSQKEKEIIFEVAQGKPERTFFELRQVVQELEPLAYERGLSLNGRWFLHWMTDDGERRFLLLPHGYAAETLFLATLYKGNDDADSNYPRKFLKDLRTPLRELKHWFNIPALNTLEDLIWNYIDLTSGFPDPSVELLKERAQDLKDLGLFPVDPYFWLETQGGSRDREQKYIEEYLAERKTLIEKGVPTEIFERVEHDLWLRRGREDAEKKAEKLRECFFFIAFLLKRDHPRLYDWYLKEVRSFVFKTLVSEKTESLRVEQENLEKKVNEQKFRSDLLSQPVDVARRSSEKQSTSMAIGAGLTVRRSKNVGMPGKSHGESSDLVIEPEALSSERSKLRNLEREYGLKRKEWFEAILKNEAEIIRFSAWLRSDFLLGCVFFSYILDGFRRLRLRRPAYRPSRCIVGNMVVYLVDMLAPYFMIGSNERKEKAQLHRSVSRMLYGLTGEKLSNRKVRELYRSHSQKVRVLN